MSDIHPSSFRDPSGFVFEFNGEIYRQINLVYRPDYDYLISSGLFKNLVKKNLLINHSEVDAPVVQPETAYKIIKVEPVRYLSYPYEWSFSQYKDAALLTLKLQKEALNYGMILKDASAYNVQFHHGHPVFIDTLSFSKYVEGTPWVGYRQFCQHFLAPLALMALTDIRLSRMMVDFIDGIPLDLASKLLPASSKFNYGLLTHIHLHALAQSKYAGSGTEGKKAAGSVSRMGLVGLIENLENTIRKLNWHPEGTAWVDYYQATNYSDHSFGDKIKIVESLIRKVAPQSMIDLGANTGVFSRLAKGIEGCSIVSTDIDPGAVEVNYLESKKAKEIHLLPLLMDLTNPSPAIGWENKERSSFFSRGPVDLVMALALIHHLAISNNLPLAKISGTLAKLGKYLIIEFVPKEDSQVQRLLASREDIFPLYTIQNFRDTFTKDFKIIEEIPVQQTKRTVFLLKRK